MADTVKSFLEIIKTALTAQPWSNVPPSMKHCSQCMVRRATSPAAKLVCIIL